MSAMLTAADPFESLNAEQRLAVEHGVGAEATDRRALLVIAGAGSGKTDTLAHRVANLIVHGADPQRLLLLTFSRRAAAEMERRAGSVLARVLNQTRGATIAVRPAALPWSGTFHGVGARLLREYASQIGLDSSFTIQDRGDSEDLLGLVRHEAGLSSTKNRFPQKGTCIAIYSRVINSQQSLAEVLEQNFPWCAMWEDELKALFGRYVDAKQAQNVLDYDDLLLFWSDMMADRTISDHLAQRFDHVLVDEYQDTNRLQAAILVGLKPDGAGVTVVGDDAQSIYGFRGATVRNILDFCNSFRLPAHRIALTRNYRSTQAILDASNAVIADASERHAKSLWTERKTGAKPQLVLVQGEAEQAQWVTDRVLQQREEGLSLQSQAVLFRTASHSAALELELARRNIPFVKFGGLKFLEAAHVKDLLALLRFAQNPRGRIAAFRILQLIPGIGPAHASRLLEAIGAAADPDGAVRSFQPPPAVASDWSAFAQTWASLRDPDLRWPADVDLAKRWYLPHLERIHDDAALRRGDLDHLELLAAGYPGRERFLEELTLDPPAATSDRAGVPGLDEDYLILSTVHSAKGQEWRSVHVLNVVDGCIPSDIGAGTSAEIDEERRLLYVAMTRARDHLHLLVPQRFYVTQQAALGDRHVYASRTRFITDQMLPLFDQVAASRANAVAPLHGASDTPMRVQVRERAKAAWR